MVVCTFFMDLKIYTILLTMNLLGVTCRIKKLVQFPTKVKQLILLSKGLLFGEKGASERGKTTCFT